MSQSLPIQNIRNVRDVIPESLKLVGNELAASSIVNERRTVRTTPSAGTGSYTENQVIDFRLSSTREFIVPSSACLNATVTLAGGATVDDLATALFRQLDLKVGGIQVESTNQLNQAVQNQVAAGVSKAVYRNKMAVDSKAWKHVPTLGQGAEGACATSAGANPTQAEFDALSEFVQATRENADGVAARYARAATATTYNVSVPLSYLSSLFRVSSLLPLAFFGNIEIRLVCASNTEALVGAGGSFTLSNVNLTTDNCIMASTYMRALASALASNDDAMKFRMPVNTIRSTIQNKTATENDFIFSAASPMLRSLLFNTKLVADAAATGYSVSALRYAYAANPRIRLEVGSQVYPQYDFIKNATELARMNSKSAGAQGEVFTQVGLQDANNYNLNDESGVAFIHFNFDTLVGLNEPDMLYGLDTTGMGGVVSLHADNTGAGGNVQTQMIVEATRVVELGGGDIQIIG